MQGLEAFAAIGSRRVSMRPGLTPGLRLQAQPERSATGGVAREPRHALAQARGPARPTRTAGWAVVTAGEDHGSQQHEADDAGREECAKGHGAPPNSSEQA
jgi:hypothetical protein